jgi:CCR4-NOT transcriptional complex subunit CAF120
MYAGNKTNDRKRVLYMALGVTQAFAVYPERPEIIQHSTLFKIEATIKEGQVRSL